MAAKKLKVTIFDYDSREFMFFNETQIADGDPLTPRDVLEHLEMQGLLELNYFNDEDMKNEDVDYPEDDDTRSMVLKKWGI